MAESFFPSRVGQKGFARTKERANPPSLRPYQLLALFSFLDFFVVALSGLVAFLVFDHQRHAITMAQYGVVGCIIAGSSLLFFVSFGCYRVLPLDLRAQLPALFIGLTLPLFLMAASLIAQQVDAEYWREWLLSWWAVGLVALTVERFAGERVRARLVASKQLAERFAIYGAGDYARPMIERMQRHEGIEIVGIFDDRQGRVASEIAGIPVFGGMSQLAAAAQQGGIDRVVIALPLSALARIQELARALYALPLTIDIGFDACQEGISLKRGSRVADALLIELLDRPLDGWRRLIKIAEDRLLSALALLAILPVLIVIAVAVKLDSPGPVFFRQKRYGFGGTVFEALKFRTMHDAQTDALGAQLTQRNDPRITRVGGFLRRHSLDELPQLINVLRGDMSLVGPRPHPLAAKAADIPYHDAIAQYAVRHRVKPGITGWAQVNGWRGETETLLQLEKRVEHDIFYIEHWSLWLDLRILLRTVICVFNTADVF